MRPIELVVAVRRDHERVHRLDAAAEQPKDVERCLVRPVHVLDDDDRGLPGAQLVAERRKDGLRLLAPLDDVREGRAALERDVHERPQRTRCVQTVARPPQDAGRVGTVAAELLNERRLADARLAGDEREPARALADVIERGGERLQLRGALEQILFRSDRHWSESCARLSRCASFRPRAGLPRRSPARSE